MKRAVFIFSTLFIFSTSVFYAHAELYYLTPIEDNWVFSHADFQDTNFGKEEDVRAWVD
jgi:hypothetical protein